MEITQADALKRLKSMVSYNRNIGALADEFGVSIQFMSAVLHGRKRMTDTMLQRVGVSRRVIYEALPASVGKTFGEHLDSLPPAEQVIVRGYIDGF